MPYRKYRLVDWSALVNKFLSKSFPTFVESSQMRFFRPTAN